MEPCLSATGRQTRRPQRWRDSRCQRADLSGGSAAPCAQKYGHDVVRPAAANSLPDTGNLDSCAAASIDSEQTEWTRVQPIARGRKFRFVRISRQMWRAKAVNGMCPAVRLHKRFRDLENRSCPAVPMPSTASQSPRNGPVCTVGYSVLLVMLCWLVD